MNKAFELDIDRLHANVHAIHSWLAPRRADGTTKAYLELMYGEAELGDPHNFYLYVGYNSTMADDMLNQFKWMLDDRQIDPDPTDTSEFSIGLPYHYLRSGTIDVRKKTFMFSSIDKLRTGEQLRGINVDRVFYDISKEMFKGDDKRQMYSDQALMFITSAMKQRNGDII